jgi:catechol 2,3-dioxygenase-like lactoylglutathione lyase family enzyme
MRVKMCGVHVEDPAAAFRFYTGTLGFEELMAVPDHNLFIVRSPDDREGVGLLLEPSDNPIGADYMRGLHEAGIPAIVFGVHDVAGEFERLSALGVAFTREPATDASGTSAVFDDGCGNLVQLHQD